MTDMAVADDQIRTADRLAAVVGERMTARINRHRSSGNGDNTPIDYTDERVLSRAVIEEVLGEWRASAYADGRAPLSREAERWLARRVHDRLYGLGELQPYIDDPDVTDIHCGGHDNVWVHYVDGRKVRVPPVAANNAALVDLVRSGARRWGRSERRWDSEVVALDLQLPDGSRLHAIHEVTGRPVIDIRRHHFDTLHRLGQLEEKGVVDRAMAEFLAAVVRARRNVLVAGTRGVGKTTMLRCLINEVPPEERIVTIEDSLELGIGRFADLHPDVESIEARPANSEGQGAFDLSDGVYQALRMQGRLIVGETRGPEVVPMLKALSSGDEGSMSTIHAMSSANAFQRLKMYARMVADPFPVDVVAEMVAESIHFVVFLSWDGGDPSRRRVQSIREVVGADGHQVVSNEVWAPDHLGRAVPHARLTAASERRLAAVGFDLALRDRLSGWWGP